MTTLFRRAIAVVAKRRHQPLFRRRPGRMLGKLFSELAKRPAAEQELLASWILAELAAEDDFDRKVSASSDVLERLAEEALAEHHAGLTEELDPDRL